MPTNWLGSRSRIDLPDPELEEEGAGETGGPGTAVSAKPPPTPGAATSTSSLDLKAFDNAASKKQPPLRRIYVNLDPKEDPVNFFHPHRRASKFRSPTLETFRRLSSTARLSITVPRNAGPGKPPGAAGGTSPSTGGPGETGAILKTSDITTPSPAGSPRKLSGNGAGTMKQVMATTHASLVGFPSNKVRTSKYTVWTFVPKNLFEQFRSVANFYFTSLVILQLFPPFEQVSPALTAAPIVFIVGVTMVKDGLEDLKRHVADRSVNKSKTYLLTPPWTNVNYLSQSGANAGLAGTRLNLHANPEAEPDAAATKRRGVGWSFPNLLDVIWPPPPLTNHPKFVGPPGEVVAKVDDEMAEGEKDGKHSAELGGGHVVGGDEAPVWGQKPIWKLSDWEEVKVGDFVFLRDNDPIPADTIIISTSEPDCVCYVETKNLDGETNLKVRRGISDLAHIKTPEDCTRLRCHVDTEPPNANLYSFSGVVSISYADLANPTANSAHQTPKVSVTSRRFSAVSRRSQRFRDDVKGGEDDAGEDADKVHRQIPIGANGILLRGCVLRNTSWVIGIAVYTGAESKIMMNSGNTPSKRSRIDRQLNPLVMVNFLLLTAMCLICAMTAAVYTGTFIWERAPFAFATDSNETYSPAYAAVVTFFSCMIIFQAIIPIALYISVDLCKLVQSLFISMDADMYDAALDKHAAPQAWNLSDDLGQIEYIFSDKTGTLTCNMMEFRRCSINGVLYGSNFVSEATQGAMEREGRKVDKEEVERLRKEAEDRMKEEMAKLFSLEYVSEKLAFIDPLIPNHLIEAGEQGRRIREFFTLLAVCHTVLVERPKEGTEEAGAQKKIDYKAQSPDEAALVAAARDVGFTFLRRMDNVVEVDILGEKRTYTVLNVLEFNSDRKRMSVIIRRPEGQLVLLVKGADSVIFERLKKSPLPSSPHSIETSSVMCPINGDGADPDITSKHLEIFANEGLRTLCLAYRVIPDSVYEDWNKRYTAAQASIKDREAKVDAVAELIETDLTLMGATAIEDRLQDGVPDTIATLAKAGIKIWVLTGDKMETAINISFSCNLLKRHMTLIVIRSTSYAETYEQLIEALQTFWTNEGLIKQGKSHALIIDGTSLKYALHKNCKPLLLELGCRCNAVVCCRVSPLQKARVVSLVRKGLGAMCLAIGDGANDVSMIQEADVGIGIMGKEGLQAVMASDYAIGQFRFLGKLLLVHGRWGYHRTAHLILNYFYKNIVWLFVLFWYQFDCGFSASLITDFSYGMFFNTFFTLFPTMIQGIFDQDFNDRVSMQVPQLYQKGIKQQLFTMERFWVYCADAIYQSVIVYFFSCLANQGGSVSPKGYDQYLDSMGTEIGFAAIIIVNLSNAFDTSYWPWITFFGVIASLTIWTAYVIVYATSIANPTYGVVGVTLQSPLFYAYLLLTVFVAMLPRIVFKFLQQYFSPSDSDIIAEAQKYFWREGAVLNADLCDEGQVSTVHPESETASQHLSTEPMLMKVPATDETTMKRVKSDCALDIEAARRTSVGAPPPGFRRSTSEKNLGGLMGAATPASEPPTATKTSVKLLAAKEDDKRVTTPDGFLPVGATADRRFSIEGEKPDLAKIQKQRRGTGVGLRPDMQLLKKAGEIIKSSASKIKKPISPTTVTTVTPTIRSTARRPTSMSLVFMGTQEELPNLGFCFSHEGGMADVITPSRPGLGASDEQLEDGPDGGTSRRRSRSTPPSRMSIHGSIKEAEFEDGNNLLHPPVPAIPVLTPTNRSKTEP
ncbi:hypothetical protein HDU96_005864 [Phlyctochytrium bullatum]|nr:hypothetical protein HDU96_005864 [Phlyctochytrium bullatum]